MELPFDPKAFLASQEALNRIAIIWKRTTASLIESKEVIETCAEGIFVCSEAAAEQTPEKSGQ